jgi:hypothetical protein
VAVAAEREADRFRLLAAGRQYQLAVAMVVAAAAADAQARRRSSREGETRRWDERAAAAALPGRPPTSPARCPAGRPATPVEVEA